MSPTPIKHYLQFSDFGPEEYEYLLDRARILKAKFKNYETWHPLHDRTLAMIFEKNSKHAPVVRSRHPPARRPCGVPEHA
jgi:ornithine carbamoyltransferase